MFGFLNINKPSGKTSHDIVQVLRKITKIRQIGHTGTLDPLADGVLPVAIGKAARLIEYLNDNKAYIASLEFGKISDTYDTEGVISKYSDKKVEKQQIAEALKEFSGEIEQIPPVYSAVHYNGQRLYELARRGRIPEDIPKRKVRIYKIELVDFDEGSQSAKILVECSSGTYIRSIVNDLGLSIGTGAVMNGLTRTAAGDFCIDNSVDLDELCTVKEVEDNLINPLDVLPFNCYNLSENEYEKVKHGQSLACENQQGIIVLTYNNRLAAIAEQSLNELKVKKVFEI